VETAVWTSSRSASMGLQLEVDGHAARWKRRRNNVRGGQGVGFHALPLAPLTLDTPAHRREAYELDRCLRRWLAREGDSSPCAAAAAAKWRALLASRGDTLPGAPQGSAREDARGEAAFQVYTASTAPWYDAATPSLRTTAHWVTFTLSFGGVIVAIVVIWLLGILAYQRRAIDDRTKERIVLAFLLFVLYLPLAVYVDWYQHYYLFSHLKESSVKIVAFVLALVAFVLVLVVIGDPKKILPWVAGLGVLGSFGVALKYPAVLISVADAVDIMPPSLVIGVITLLCFFVVVLADIYVREKAAGGP
jgi:hypothetical protein